MSRCRGFITLSIGCVLACAAQAQQMAPTGQDAAQAVDNGTDPTRFSRMAEVRFEHLDLKDGFGSNTLRLGFTQPLGEKRDLSLRVTAGRVIGAAFGGNAIVFVKPSVFAGRDRPSSWGLEVGLKLIGF